MIWLALVVLLLGGAETDTIIFEETSDAMMWSPDSQQLTFFYPYVDGGYVAMLPTMESENWFTYDVAAGELTASDTWPMQPELSDEEMARLDPLEEAYLFPAPDGEWLLYPASQRADNTLYPFRLASADGETILDVGLQAEESVIPDVRQFRVVWNADGSAFAVHDICCVYGPTVDLHYFKRTEAGVESFNFAFTPLMDGREFYTPNVSTISDRNLIHDISEDGKRVLVSASEVDTENVFVFLMWQPETPEESVIFEDINSQAVIAASFAPDDESRLLLLEETRLACYDTVSSRFIQEMPITETVYLALFSPDGRWLAYPADSGLHIMGVGDFCAP